MKINPIKFLEGKYGLSYVKNPNSKVFLPLQVESDTYNRIQKMVPELEKAAERSKMPIHFAPLGDARTLMNFGTKTKVLENSWNEANIAKNIYKHIDEVENFNKSIKR